MTMKMKFWKVPLTLAAAAILLGGLSGARAEEEKAAEKAKPVFPIAVLDMQQVVESSSAGKSILSQLKSRREALQKEASSLEKKLREEEQKLIQGRKEMKPEDFEKKKKEFEAEFAKDRQTILKKSSELENSRKAALRNLRDQIGKVSADLADERKYMLIVDREFVVITEQSMDVTAEVLKRLNETVKTVPLPESGKKD
jgi:outer membrane protein